MLGIAAAAPGHFEDRLHLDPTDVWRQDERPTSPRATFQLRHHSEPPLCPDDRRIARVVRKPYGEMAYVGT